MPSETKESPWRPAEIVAAFCQIRDQCVGDVDIHDGLLGHDPERLHGFSGLIAQLAIDAALEAVQPPQFDLRSSYLFGRIRQP
jgi:hypothetical protein